MIPEEAGNRGRCGFDDLFPRVMSSVFASSLPGARADSQPKPRNSLKLIVDEASCQVKCERVQLVPRR